MKITSNPEDKFRCTHCKVTSKSDWSIGRHSDRKHAGLATPVLQKDYPLDTPLPIADPIIGNHTQSRSHSKKGFQPGRKQPNQRPSEPEEHSLFDINEMGSQFLKLVRDGLVSRAANYVLNAAASQNIWTGIAPQPEAYAFITANTSDVFGYTVSLCEKCKTLEPLEVFFSPDKGLISLRGHECNITSQYAEKILPTYTIEQRTGLKLLALRDQLLGRWSLKNISLVLIPIPSPEQSQITLQHPARQDRWITLELDKEGIPIPAERLKAPELGTEYWLVRLLKQGQIMINEKELVEFLGLCNFADKTFVKIQIENKGGSIERYLVFATNLHWKTHLAGPAFTPKHASVN